MYKMDTQLLKRNLLERCKEIQGEKIQHLELAMQEAEKSAHELGQVSDMFDAQRMQLIGSRDMYAGQLKGELELLETLYKIEYAVSRKKVEFGSLVLTDMQNVFISIGLGKVTLNDEVFYAISTKVPFYQAMQGLKKGQTFDFRGKQIKILDVF